jgi:CRISPR/Cas system CSM-associated protein Csm3 (group 7 of RAMP superfamily)
MKCPPIDERENRQFEKLQHQAVTAILERSTFEHYCFLTQLTKTPGDPRPEELAFAVKGLLRCNFRLAPQGEEWRRLFGTTKRRWHDDNWKGLPLSWRSRVLFQTFQTHKETEVFLKNCNLRLWSSQASCPLLNNLSTGEPAKPWVLLQVEDVKLDGDNTFSDKLRDFLASGKSIFRYHSDCKCPQPFQFPQNSQNTKPEPRAETIQITWQLEPSSLLLTGVSLDFAKAFFGQKGEPHSRNLRLSQSKNPAQLTPALLVSSLKGVFRAAMAWLLEKIARDNGWAAQQHSCTSDYRSEKDQNLPCPLRAILGGPLPVEHPGQDTEKSEKGLIRFLAPHGSYFSGRVRGNWQQEENRFRFARKLLQDKQRDQALLHIETIKLDENSCVVTEIAPGRYTHAALLALCLAADLISAGFFRVGRFTSRGFGIVRLKPVSVSTGTLIDLLEERGTERPRANANSGFELLTRTFKIADPLGQLASWLQQFTAPNPGEAP